MNNETKNHPLRFAFLLTVFCALGPFTLDMYLSSFPQIMKFFGTTVAMVQASLTAGLLGLSLGQIIIGTLSDVYGRRKPLLISMIIYFISSVGCVFAPNIILNGLHCRDYLKCCAKKEPLCGSHYELKWYRFWILLRLVIPPDCINKGFRIFI